MRIIENILKFLHNGNLEVPSNVPFTTYNNFLRELILDRHLIIYKPDAVAINYDRAKPKLAERHDQVGDSYIEICNHMMNRIPIVSIFKDIKEGVLADDIIVKFYLHKNVNKIGDPTIHCTVSPIPAIAQETMYEVRRPNGNDAVQILYTDDTYMAHVIRTKNDEPVVMSVRYTSGYGIHEVGSKKFNNKDEKAERYFPANTDYSLQEFVRVLPPNPSNRNVVRLRYLHGMTEQIFLGMLYEYNEYCKLNDKLATHEENTLRKAIVYNNPVETNDFQAQATHFVTIPYAERKDRFITCGAQNFSDAQFEKLWRESFERSVQKA